MSYSRRYFLGGFLFYQTLFSEATLFYACQANYSVCWMHTAMTNAIVLLVLATCTSTHIYMYVHIVLPYSLHEGVKFLIRAEVNHAPGS